MNHEIHQVHIGVIELLESQNFPSLENHVEIGESLLDYRIADLLVDYHHVAENY